jgi:putative transposase
MMSVLTSLLATLQGAVRDRAALHLEVLALRHQLQVLQRSQPRHLRLANADRWLWAWLSHVWGGWRTALVIVQPETVVAWHRKDFVCSGPGRVGDVPADPSSLRMCAH